LSFKLRNTPMEHRGRTRALLAAATTLAAIAAVAWSMPMRAGAVAVPPAPTGLTAIALDGSVELAWQPVSGATGYVVYRGSSPTSVTTAITPVGGVVGTSFTDSSAVDGTTYYYDVTALGTSGESVPSNQTGATPQARSCSSGNAIVVENCFPGTTNWKLVSPAQPPTGIEGFATATSVNAGGSVDLKVNTASGAPYHIEIYRTGYYGGSEARLVSVIPGLSGVAQPYCQKDYTTGLTDCSNWSTTATITTTPDWPTGVYLLRLVRDDNGTDYHILLVVRNDASASSIFYAVPVTTYQAYNNWGGKSLYAYNSTGSNTVADTPQAVEVSFDRPFNQPLNGDRNWYTKSDIQNVSWLEQQGYDVSYGTSIDLQANGAQLTSHKVYISPSHDEYWSAEMRGAVTSALNSGISLLYLGSNADYWKIRFEASPYTGVANRIEVCYKSIATGVPDPSGIPTTTWRDPVVNQPENGLIGQMYIGDNDPVFFPLVVTAAEAQTRVWRYTTLTSLAPGTQASIGQNLVGWEWDARVANGAEPPGVITVASSPVNGELLQDAGSTYANGSATTDATYYRASSGAWVFSTGTNQWSRGLGYNMDGVGEPNPIIKQATVNVLADMGVLPTTPSAGLVFDQTGAPKVTQTSPANGATGVAVNAPVTATFNQQLDPSSVTAKTFTLTDSSGNTVAATVSYNQSTLTATLTPSSSLLSGASYTATLGTGIVTWTGTPLSSPVSFGFKTSSVVTVGATTPANGATNVSTATSVTATFSAAVDPSTLTSTTFSLTDASGNAVPATISYSSSTLTATLTPNAALQAGVTYTANVTTGVKGTDGTPLSAPATWSFTTTPPPANCPCRLFPSSLTPSVLHASTQDGRTGTGPFSYELGVKIQVTSPVQLTAIRFYKDSQETGTHVGTVWSSSGSVLARVTFANETASGWQQQALPTLLVLQPGNTYVVSVGVNSYFVDTPSGLANQFVTGPLQSVADGKNGVFASSAGSFPTQTYKSTNYFVDAVVYDKTGPATVTQTSPSNGATGVSWTPTLTAQFDRPVDPTSVTASTFTLQDANGNLVPATVTYNGSTFVASLTPSSPLQAGMTYTANLSSGIVTWDGSSLSPTSFSFKTAGFGVSQTSPASGATGVSASATVSATFTGPIDPSTLTSQTFTLTDASGNAVPATISYSSSTLTATLTPSSPLRLGTVFTATLTSGIKSTGGTSLTPNSFSFTTKPLVVSQTTPAGGTSNVGSMVAPTATFSAAVDPSTLTSQTFTLTDSSGNAVPATISYSSSTLTATLTPSSPLNPATTYTAALTSGVKGADGSTLSSPPSWSFTTASCPCSLFSSSASPAGSSTTQDGRSGSGPWTYELGVKIQVGSAVRLTAIRFYKDSRETGTHVGTVWSSSGTVLAQTTFANETASGWQQQALSAPLTLQPGQTYVVSVGFNAYFDYTTSGLQSQVTNGPLQSVADGKNGVFASSAGTFPTQSYKSTNYFVDLVVS
jgi:hypothetical protein